MKKIACTIACALAFATMAPLNVTRTLESAPVARVALLSASVSLATPADVSVVGTGTSLQELTPTAMSEVRGAGWWSKIVNIVKKVAKWIWDNRGWIQTAIEQQTRRTTDVIGTTDGLDRNDYYSQDEHQDEYYDANGNLTNSTFSADAEVYQASEFSGGT
jgi:hypothetical protein